VKSQRSGENFLKPVLMRKSQKITKLLISGSAEGIPVISYYLMAESAQLSLNSQRSALQELYLLQKTSVNCEKILLKPKPSLGKGRIISGFLNFRVNVRIFEKGVINTALTSRYVDFWITRLTS
jgi:hypothetical protein